MKSESLLVRQPVSLHRSHLKQCPGNGLIPAIAAVLGSLGSSAIAVAMSIVILPAPPLVAQTVTQTPPSQPESPHTDSKQPPSPTTGSQPSTSKPAAQTRNDDRVNIDEIYPEYCRSYFFRRDSVSLFEYREGMYRCLYGVDH